MKTYIINETSTPFLLKEGNAGAFRTLKELKGKDDKKNSKYTIKVDLNATYREYMVATGKKGKTIYITSDEFSQYEEIRIVTLDPPAGAPPGTPVTYRSVLSKPRKKSMPECPGDPSHAGDMSSPGGSSDPVVPSGEGESAPVVLSGEGESAPVVPSGEAESALVVPSVEGESAPVVPSGEDESATVGQSAETEPAPELSSAARDSIPKGSSNAGPGEANPGGSLKTGGSNHVAWYKKLFKPSK